MLRSLKRSAPFSWKKVCPNFEIEEWDAAVLDVAKKKMGADFLIFDRGVKEVAYQY
jgi:hypothetical protein